MENPASYKQEPGADALTKTSAVLSGGTGQSPVSDENETPRQAFIRDVLPIASTIFSTDIAFDHAASLQVTVTSEPDVNRVYSLLVDIETDEFTLDVTDNDYRTPKVPVSATRLYVNLSVVGKHIRKLDLDGDVVNPHLIGEIDTAFFIDLLAEMAEIDRVQLEAGA